MLLGLKLVHVLAAIVAVGFNATYGILIVSAQNAALAAAKGTDDAAKTRTHDRLLFTLETVLKLDRIANWAYTALFITGFGLVHANHWSFKTLWISASLVLLVAALGVTHALYTPTMKKQIASLSTGSVTSPEYSALAKRSTAIGLSLFFVALAVVGLMIFKPTS